MANNCNVSNRKKNWYQKLLELWTIFGILGYVLKIFSNASEQIGKILNIFNGKKQEKILVAEAIPVVEAEAIQVEVEEEEAIPVEEEDKKEEGSFCMKRMEIRNDGFNKDGLFDDIIKLRGGNVFPCKILEPGAQYQ